MPLSRALALTSALGAEAAQLRGRDRLDLVVEDDTLDDKADIAAVKHMGDIGHWNNDEAPGVSGQCRLDTLLNGEEGQGFCVVDAVGVMHGGTPAVRDLG